MMRCQCDAYQIPSIGWSAGGVFREGMILYRTQTLDEEENNSPDLILEEGRMPTGKTVDNVMCCVSAS